MDGLVGKHDTEGTSLHNLKWQTIKITPGRHLSLRAVATQGQGIRSVPIGAGASQALSM